MKFVVPESKTQKKQTVRLLKMLFPALGAVAAWRFFYKKRRSIQFLHVQKKKRTLGLIGVSTLAFLGVRVLYLQYLAVDKKKQGTGVGTEILKKLEDKAKRDKHDFIFLSSHSKRKKAHRFYKKNGFLKLFGALFLKRI